MLRSDEYPPSLELPLTRPVYLQELNHEEPVPDPLLLPRDGGWEKSRFAMSHF
jgi:hypothetical protein